MLRIENALLLIAWMALCPGRRRYDNIEWCTFKIMAKRVLLLHVERQQLGCKLTM